MKANYRGEYGEMGGTVGVFFTATHYKPDRQINTVPLFQQALVRSLNRNRHDKPKVTIPDAQAYAQDGTVAVAVDGTFKVRDRYHNVRDVTETWLKCRNVMLEKDAIPS
jgi:hypothetical protein